MATLVGDPFRKKTENPFEQFGNWISKSFQDIGQNIQRVFNPSQNQNQVQTRNTSSSFNNANRSFNQTNTGLRTLNNNNFQNRSTNTLNSLAKLDTSQFQNKNQANVGGDNVIEKQIEQPKFTTINSTPTTTNPSTKTNINNSTLNQARSGFGINASTQEFEQKLERQKQEKQAQTTRRQQILNQRADQARSFYDDSNSLNSLYDKVNSSKDITNKSYTDIAGQSISSVAEGYRNNALRKLANDDMTLSNRSSDLIDKYRSLSSDDRWDVYQNLQKAKNKLTQVITKADDEGRNDLKNAYASQLSEINLYDEMLANEEKGEKSFGKSLADYLSGGAFVGNMAEPVTNIMGNVTGNQETSRAISQDRATTKEGNSKIFDVADFVGETTANIAGNALTGGAYGLASSGANLGDAIQSAINDRNRQYYTDYEGNLTRENQSTASKVAGIGNAALGLGMTVAGMKGFGPNIKFNNAGQTLQSAINNRQWGDLAKTMGKYAMKEVPFAVGQTALQQGISAAGGDQEFGENFGQQLASNIAGDLAVDVTGAMRQGRGGSRDLFRGDENDPGVMQRINNALEKAPIGLTVKRVDGQQSDNTGTASGQAKQNDIPVGQKATQDMRGTEMDVTGQGQPTNGQQSDTPALDKLGITNNKNLSGTGQQEIGIIRQGGQTPLQKAMEIKQQTKDKIVARADGLDQKIVDRVNDKREPRIVNDVKNGIQKDKKGFMLTRKAIKDGQVTRKAEGKAPFVSGRNSKLYAERTGPVIEGEYPKGHYRAHEDELGGVEGIVKTMRNTTSSKNSEAFPTSKNQNTIYASETADNGKPASTVVDQKLGIRSVSPRKENWIKNNAQAKSDLLGGSLGGGDKSSIDIGKTDGSGSPISARQATDSSVAQNGENVNGKPSSFANKTVQQSEEVSDAVKAKVADDNVTYRPTSNAEHLAKSEDFMSSRSLSEAESDITNRVINQKAGEINDQDVSDAIAVAKALDAKGDSASMERASAIYDSLSKHATKKGQTLQALSLLDNRTPEGLRYGAEKAIRKGGTEVTPEIHKKVVANTNAITTARKDVASAQKAYDNVSARATELYQRGNKNISRQEYHQIMTDLEAAGTRLDNAKHQLDRSYATLSKTVADNTKQSAGNIYSTIHKGGLLSAPTTHIKNITSNAAFAGLKKITDAPAAAMDAMISKITGKRTKVFTMRGEAKGGWKGLKYGAEVMRTGVDELDGSSGKYSSGFPELRFKGKIRDFLIGNPNRLIFRAMSAGDKPFRYAAQANSLNDQAIAQAKTLGLKGKAREIFVKQFISDPPKAALEKSWSDGENAVLGQSNMVSKVVNSMVKNLEGSDNVGAKAFGTFLDAHVVPFVKVPTNFLIETSRYTPVGAGAEAVKIVDDIVHHRGFDQRAFVEATSKSTIGTAGLVALGGLLANNFTGEYPEDEKERNRWEAEGIKENSIKVGNAYVPLEAFGPASLLMGAGAQFWKSINEGSSVLDATGQSMAQLARSLEDQSFLTGISDVLNVIEGKTSVGGSISNYVKQNVASVVPNISKKLAASLDPYARSTGKKTGLVEQTVASVMNSVPGLRTLLPAKVDAYGNDLKNGSFLSGFIDPSGSGRELQGDNEMIKEVARLHDAAGALELTDEEKKELEVTPSDVDYKFGPSGNQVDLTDDEQRELTRKTGQLISKTWTDTMGTDEYKNADDLTKARLLADGRKAAVNLAKQQFGSEHGYEAPKASNDAKALANGTFTAQASGGGGGNKKSIEINDSIDQSHKDILNQYNSMSSEDWEKYERSADGRDAEYKLALAKFENDKANGNLTEVQEVKRQKELRKMDVQKSWDKDVRDAYGLAGNKADMQELLNSLENRDDMVAYLNAMNRAMYESGVITASTYKTRNRNINNLSSSSGGGKKSSSAYSASSRSALSALAKALSSGSGTKSGKTPSAPSTSRKMASTSLKGTNLKKYTVGKANITVKKGIK